VNLGKLFTQPLTVTLVGAWVAWFLLRARLRPSVDRPARRAFALLGVLLLALTILSTPVVGRLLERTLLIDMPDTPPSVDAIVVLAGGYSSDERILSGSTIERVTAGVEWWRRCPSAVLVMSGESGYDDGRNRPLMTALMAELAETAGVPAERVVRDTWSTSTRLHPLGVLRLDGMTPETRIGLVSSRWHLRRATTEFRRHFRYVHPWTDMGTDHALLWTDFVPQTAGIDLSTPMIHEWIGIVWYRVLHALGR